MKKSNKVTLICTESFCSQGPRILSSCLKKAGFSSNLIFLSNFESRLSEHTLNQVDELCRGSLFVGVSCMCISEALAVQVMRYLKDRKYIVVLGGIHATLNPEKMSEFADYLCIGEGEEAIVELALNLYANKMGSKILNILKTGDDTRKVPNLRPLIPNLDSLPYPDYDLSSQFVLIRGRIKKARPEMFSLGEHNIASRVLAGFSDFVLCQTVRGCPYDCVFCCNHDLKRLYSGKGSYIRKRSPENAILQVYMFKKKVVVPEIVWFIDDDFFLRSKDELISMMNFYKRKIGIPFMCYLTPMTFDKKKFEVLLDGGMYMVEIGLQTGSREFSARIYNRKCSPNRIFKMSSILSRYSSRMFPPIYQVMYMNPLEHASDTLRTIELIQRLTPPFYLMPLGINFFPGNAMYKIARKKIGGQYNLNDFYKLSYRDYYGHIKLMKERRSLHMLVHLMGGINKKHMCGKLPRFLVKRLASLAAKEKDGPLFALLNIYSFLYPSNIIWRVNRKYQGLYLELLLSCLRMRCKLRKLRRRIILNTSRRIFH
ncbi:MAG: radical SAM protein [Candidatus Woesearchaeota archaeon]